MDQFGFIDQFCFTSHDAASKGTARSDSCKVILFLLHLGTPLVKFTEKKFSEACIEQNNW